MKKIILCFIIVLSVQSLFAQEESPKNIKTELQSRYNFDPDKSHWLAIFGFETIKYPLTYNYVGKKQSFTDYDAELWGGRLGFGGEIGLGAGFHTATRVDGYYMGSLFTKERNAGPEYKDVKISSRKDSNSLYGIDASQSLSFLFDMKTKNPFLDEWSYMSIEPFVEAGIGIAQAHNRRNYKTDTGTCPTCVYEEYRASINDQITTAKISAGINFISTSGYFLYLKATQYTLNINERTIKEYSQPDDQAGVQRPEQKLKDVDTDPVMVYALGGGYKF